jgi:phosphomevalonate kinase
MEVIASAPGKVFVAGEYGVLVGGPAVIAALDLRLGCRVRWTPGTGRVQVENGRHRAEWSPREGLAALPAEVRFAATAALVALQKLGATESDVRVDTASDLDGASAKRGLGGSAAVTAATIGAIYRAAGRACDASDLRERVSLGVEAHRLAQGGGSGADVVAATVGGLVLVGDLDASSVPTGLADCRGATRVGFERLELPAPLALALAATGRAAASAPRARRFAAKAAGDGRARDPALARWCAEMGAAVLDLATGCRTGNAAMVMAATDRAGGLLERLAPLADLEDLPIMTPELRSAVDVARGCGAAAKPSGAGGGDCAIALIDASRCGELGAAWARAGLEPILARIDRRGVETEATGAAGEVWDGAG